jgi:hypothetical protein
VFDAISNPSLNGTYLVQSVPDDHTFTIQITQATSATYTRSTDPNLSVASGQAGTGSGMSDVGGEDSLITLGLWGGDGQTVPVQAGTFMHELGHTLGLTHGGFYYDTPNSYIPTVEPNCKPNFQSVMSYFFQVDLLDNGVPDYSEQELSPLNENSLLGVPGVTTTDGSATAYSITKWYALTRPSGVGTAATHHCDGTPLSPTDPTMYRLEGPTAPIPWSNGLDINFDGKINASLRGYNDWAHIDLRQIGATGSESTGGTPFSGGGTPFSGGGTPFSGGGTPFSGGGTPFSGGGTPFSGGGVGHTEITYEVANSVVRPPRNLSAALTSSNYVQLNWMAPSFGQISAYNIYRAVNGGPPSLYKSISGSPPPTAYTDQNVSCATYTYFVTAVLADGRESVPSNLTAPIPVPCIFIGFLSPLKTAGDNSYSGAFEDDVIPIKWQIKDASGHYISDLTVNTLGESFSPLPKNGVCPLPSTVPPGSNLTTLYSPSTGVARSKVPPNNTFTYDKKSNQFVFKWNSEGFQTGCYIIELDLRDGQVKRTSLRLYER